MRVFVVAAVLCSQLALAQTAGAVAVTVDAGTIAQPEVPPLPADAAPTPAVATITPPTGVEQSVAADGSPARIRALGRNWWERVEPFGYARVGLFLTFPFRDDEVAGSNGGFRVASIRLGIAIRPLDDLEVVASLEAGVGQPNSLEPNVGTRGVGLADGYAEYRVNDAFLIRAGQFKAPFWGETLMPDALLPFINRSPIGEGYQPPEMQSTRGPLTLDRQVGVQLSSRPMGSKTVRFRYALAVVNGNGPNQLFNDNNSVAPVGRVEVQLFDLITVGGNGYFNVRAEGERANRINSTRFGYGADLAASFKGFTLLAGYLGRTISYDTAAVLGESSLGAMGQLHYAHARTGLEAGVRFTVFNPSSAQPEANLTELAAILAWQLRAWPLRVVLQYTHRAEPVAVAFANDSVDVLFRANW